MNTSIDDLLITFEAHDFGGDGILGDAAITEIRYLQIKMDIR